MPNATWSSREELQWERDRLLDLFDRVQGEISRNLDDRPFGMWPCGESDSIPSPRDCAEVAVLRAEVALLRATAEVALGAIRGEVEHLLIARQLGGDGFRADADSALGTAVLESPGRLVPVGTAPVGTRRASSVPASHS